MALGFSASSLAFLHSSLDIPTHDDSISLGALVNRVGHLKGWLVVGGLHSTNLKAKKAALWTLVLTRAPIVHNLTGAGQGGQHPGQPAAGEIFIPSIIVLPSIQLAAAQFPTYCYPHRPFV